MYFPQNARAGQSQRAPSQNFRRVSSVAPAVNAPQIDGELLFTSLPFHTYQHPEEQQHCVCLHLDLQRRGWALTAGSLKKSDLWTQSRQNLEEAIEEEKENTDHNWDSDLLSHEQRLEQRLNKLKLDMFIMGADGACQVHLLCTHSAVLCCFASCQV